MREFLVAPFGAIVTAINLRVTTMMVRNLGGITLVLAVATSFGATARAAELPSRQTLDQMGLSGLSIMSDEAALAVRGAGYGKVFGFSWASVTTPNASAGSVNGYVASGKNGASGHNYSRGEIEIEQSGGYGGGGYGSKKGGGHEKELSISAFGGGGSTAKVKSGNKW